MNRIGTDGGLAETLESFLCRQIAGLEVPERQRQLLYYLVGCLEDSGYLTTPPEELAAGAGVPEEELRRMAEIIGQNRLRVVSDEIHCDLNRTGLRRIPMGKVMQDYERLITCISTGKTFNLARLLHSNIIIRSAQERARFQARDKNIGAVNPLSIAAHQAAYTHGGP